MCKVIGIAHNLKQIFEVLALPVMTAVHNLIIDEIWELSCFDNSDNIINKERSNENGLMREIMKSE